MPAIIFKDLGTIEYGAAWDLQEGMMREALTLKAERNPENIIPNHLLFCSHPHVYTLGKSGDAAHLLLSEERLKEIDATYYKTNRGGDITYHGPGQIVGYPILDLEQFRTDLGWYMRSLEEVIIRVLAHYGIEAGRLEGSTGVWLDAGTLQARKICAMGVRSSRWMTMHGFAFNINTNLDYFGHIIPCGIRDKGVTSLAEELGREMDTEVVKARLIEAFGEVFGAELVQGTDLPTSVDMEALG